MNLKVGFTGSKGWIGSHVFSYLKSKGHELIDLDDFLRRKSETNLEQIDNLDWVLHFAASTSIVKSFETPAKTYENNFSSTVIALEIAKKAKANFFFMSSYVYGQPEYLPVDELHPAHPVNPYMSSKHVCEVLVDEYCNIMKLNGVVFRVFNIYGSGTKKGRLISDLIEQANHKDNLVLNDSTPVRDYLHISDFNRLMEKMIQTKQGGVSLFNVGSQFIYSNSEVANLIKQTLFPEGLVLTKSSPRRSDVNKCYADISKVSKAFDWLPEVDLPEGIKKTSMVIN